MARTGTKRPSSRTATSRARGTEDSDIEEVEPPSKSRQKQPQARHESPGEASTDELDFASKGPSSSTKPNGRPQPKPKASSSKAGPSTTSAKKPSPASRVEEPASESEAIAQGSNKRKRKTPNGVATSSSSSQRVEELLAENKRLAQLCETVQAEHKKLQAQLNESLAIRYTEPEQLLQRRTEEYEIGLKNKQDVITELNRQLAIVHPLSRQNQSAVLHLITREAADEEKRTLQRDLEELRGREKDHEREIAEFKTREQELKFDLKAEQQRSNQLASQARSTNQRHPVAASREISDVAKDGETIKFYEKLTNLWVPSVNMSSRSGLSGEGESTTFKCVYMCDVQPSELEDGAVEENPPSFNFTLEFSKDDEGYEQVHYEPLHLDKESQEFTARLSYYAEPFEFAPGQLAVFMRQMREKILGLPEGGARSEGGEGDESMEIQIEDG